MLGVPFDGSGPKYGSRLGPAAVRYAGLIPQLESLGHTVTDLGDLTCPAGVPQPGHLRTFAEALPVFNEVKEKFDNIDRDSVAMLIGGDHSLAIGSIASALEKFDDLAVLWIDAHADINTPSTSPTSNLHGMPVAALLGLPSGTQGIQHEQWDQIVAKKTKLAPNRLAYMGLRDLDPGEQDHVKSLDGCFATTMFEIDLYSMTNLANSFENWMLKNGSKHLWISFDVDVFDPVFTPGTGTMVRGGLTYREGHLLSELLHLMMPFRGEKGKPFRLVGLDLVEVNPSIDQNNVTAVTAVEWVASLFGKQILPPYAGIVP